MKKILSIILISTLSLLLLIQTPSTVNAQTPTRLNANSLTKLTGFNSYGRWVDWTRNTDSWNMVPPPTEVALGQQGDDLIWMKAHNFNTIRALMFWEHMEPTEGTYNEEAFAHLDALVDACEQQGIYVTLESTHWLWSSYFPNGAGFPAWTTADYPATIEGSHDFALDFLTNNGSAANIRTKFVNLWEYIAPVSYTHLTLPTTPYV